jgi:8-oxo-dGTP diphosphatase
MRITACSAIIVRDDDDKVFIARRATTKQSLPGHWETIGGGVEPGETPQECIVRELREEIGVTPKAVRHFTDYVVDGNGCRVFIVALEGEPRPTAADFDDAGWFTPDEVASLRPMALNCDERLADYFAAISNWRP